MSARALRPRNYRSTALWQTLLATVLISACGDGTRGDEFGPEDQVREERVVGPEGATLQTASSTVVFPPGAVNAPVLVTLSEFGASVEGHDLYSPLVRLEPAGLVLNTPATVTIGHSGGARAAVYASTESDQKFSKIKKEDDDDDDKKKKGDKDGDDKENDKAESDDHAAETEFDVIHLHDAFVGDGNPCDADLDRDVENCGECGNICPNANGNASCTGGACGLSCDDEHDSCNQEPPAPEITDDDDVTCPALAFESCKNGKVSVCHIPPGNPANAHTICISDNAIAAHVNHGDACGPCGDTDGCEAAVTVDSGNCGGCGIECDDHAVCSAEGAGVCECAAGYAGDGQTCEKIDECAAGTHGCPANATCVNTANGYVCECPPGQTMVDDACVHECDEPTANNCDPNATCHDADSGFQCECNSGYEGDGITCTEIDECARGLHSCDAFAECTNTEGSYSCACNPGYIGDGFFCGDQNECSFADICDANATCENFDGGFSCECDAGYVGDGFTCEDEDECTTGTHSCSPNATCSNIVESFTCECDAGFVGDGFTCTDVDECGLEVDPCPSDSQCFNIPGSYRCDAHAVCANAGGGLVCDCVDGACDVDECTNGQALCAEQQCLDTTAGYTCTCPTGYAGDGVTCVDVDECLEGIADCTPDGECHNTPGSYACQCPVGFAGDGRFCTDVDECAEGTDTCAAAAICTNTVGGYACECPQGYTGDGQTCADVDECADETANACDEHADCINTPGNYTCECSDGWNGTGFICADVDECADQTDTCSPNAECANTPGSYVCTCIAPMEGDGTTCGCADGYAWDGADCVDIDECALDAGLCGQGGDCFNEPGSYSCVCLGGYAPAGSSCAAINPCADDLDSCDADARCLFDASYPGTYTCECNQGFSGDGFACTDVDECAAATDDCDVDATCTNVPGDFDCECPAGWSGNGRSCAPPGDPDECADGGDSCDLNATCENDDPGYQCFCNAGYDGDGFTCSDVDECALGLDNCTAHAQCVNAVGGFDCVCGDGYVWDGAGCADIDECTSGSNDCDDNATCFNEIGGYTCQCSTGYAGDGTTCADVDECLLGTDTCGQHSVCANTEGSYTCPCIGGYAMSAAAVCEDVDECARGTDTCAQEATCSNTPGSFSCACPIGFEGDGFSCSDIDECALDVDCGDQAHCVNLVGDYSCQCDPGTVGQECNPAPACATDIVASGDHTCALMDTGSVRCWGANYYGELGLGHTEPVGDDEEALAGGDVALSGEAIQLASGVTHNCALLASGEVQCWGRNHYGQLGLGHTDDIGDDELAEVGGIVALPGLATQLAAGGEHTCALFDDGSVTCWGLNIHGQLGYGNTDNLGDDETPASAGSVALAGTATQIVASRDHTCALLEGGDVQCWGRGQFGALGYGNTNDVGDDETPNAVGTVDVGAAVTQLAAGWYHTCAVVDDGAVRCWGYGDVGQLGYGDTETIGDDEAGGAGGDIDLGGTAVAIEAGVFHTCALLDDGAVRCWGYGEDGRLGQPIICNIGDDEPPSDYPDVFIGGTATDIATGFAHTCVLIDDCAVRCFGDGSFGQLGYGDTATTGTAAPAASGDVPLVYDVDECAEGTDECGAHTTCVNTLGAYECLCDPGFSGGGLQPEFADHTGQCYDIDECPLEGHICDALAECINTEGGFQCLCSSGYEGDGITCTDVDECLAGTHGCDPNATCVNDEGGYGCDCNAGFGGSGMSCDDVDECAADLDDCDAAATCENTTGSYTCACVDGYSGNGTTCEDVDECTEDLDTCVANAICTNSPGSYSCACAPGYVGDGDISCQAAPTEIAVGGDHACVMLATEGLACWGSNGWGQLGLGHTDPVGDDELPYETGPLPVGVDIDDISVGSKHTCVVTAAGSVRCWGNGASGRLGYANVQSVGDDESIVGLADVALGGTAVQVVAGAHTCALLDTGNVRCWGPNFNGTLGYAHQANIGDNEPPSDAGDLDLGGFAVELAAGELHSCALLSDGNVTCWGHGVYGQLGYGTNANIGDDEHPSAAGTVNLGGLAQHIVAGDYHTCALLTDGDVVCWGLGSDGRLGLGNTAWIGDNEVPATGGTVALGEAAVALTAGGKHTCAILDSGTVRCWGDNASGQCGSGDVHDIGDNETPASLPVLALPGEVIDLGAGSSHTCALISDGSVYCWGKSNAGQLGQANTSTHLTPQLVQVIPPTVP